MSAVISDKYCTIYLSKTGVNAKSVQQYFKQPFLNAVYNVKAAIKGKLSYARCERGLFERRLNRETRVKLLLSSFALFLPFLNIFTLSVLKKGRQTIEKEEVGELKMHVLPLKKIEPAITKPLPKIIEPVVEEEVVIEVIEEEKTYKLLESELKINSDKIQQIHESIKSSDPSIEVELANFIDRKTKRFNAEDCIDYIPPQHPFRLMMLFINLNQCHEKLISGCKTAIDALENESSDLLQLLNPVAESVGGFEYHLNELTALKFDLEKVEDSATVLEIYEKILEINQSANEFYQQINSAIIHFKESENKS